MKKVSSSSLNKGFDSREVVIAKPSMFQTVRKYGGTVTESDSSDDIGKLEVKVANSKDVTNGEGSGKSMERTEIFYNGKLLGSQG